jgi:hypothetical protein
MQPAPTQLDFKNDPMQARIALKNSQFHPEMQRFSLKKTLLFQGKFSAFCAAQTAEPLSNRASCR